MVDGLKLAGNLNLFRINTIIPRFALTRTNLTVMYFDWSIDYVIMNIFVVFVFQHGSVNAYLKPMLQRDFISLLPKQGLDHLAENILSFLDAKSLSAAQRVCKGWLNVISEGESYARKIILRKSSTLIYILTLVHIRPGQKFWGKKCETPR